MSIRQIVYSAMFLTAGLLGVLAVSGPTGATAQEGPSTPKVKQIYENDCAICHGEKGDGKTDIAASLGVVLQDLTDPKSLEGKSDQDLFNLIRNGKDKMPPEDAARAKDADVRGLVAFVRSLSKGHTGAPAAAPAAAAAPATNGPGK